MLSKCWDKQQTSECRYSRWVMAACLCPGKGLSVTLTSLTTSLLYEPLELGLSEEATLLFSEPHNLPRHFKPSKEGILARIPEK